MPEGDDQRLIDALKASYSAKIVDAIILRPRMVSIKVRKEDLLEMARVLRDELGFTVPASAGGVDWPKEDRMEVVYYLVNPSTRVTLALRTNIPRGEPRLPTLTQLWEAMSFHEREAREMLGIEFEGHPNPVKLLLPPDWRGGYPLRKDFKGEGEQP